MARASWESRSSPGELRDHVKKRGLFVLPNLIGFQLSAARGSTRGVLLDIFPNSLDSFHSLIVGEAYVPFIYELILALAVVVLANKITCGWACQLGALQDLIFRVNRNAKDRKGLLRQYKIPFRLSNTIRIMFSTTIVGAALLFSLDILTVFNPFGVFDLVSVGVIGLLTIILILIASLFVYRPWCNLFCPFGLMSWFLEKYSIQKIYVNRSTCTSCQACQKACPGYTMEAILNKKDTVPDCYLCGTCLAVCPNGSVMLGKEKKEFVQACDS